jgi:hypothetical protein
MALSEFANTHRPCRSAQLVVLFLGPLILSNTHQQSLHLLKIPSTAPGLVARQWLKIIFKEKTNKPMKVKKQQQTFRHQYHR